MHTRTAQLPNHRNFYHASLLVVEDNEDHWNLIRIVLARSLPEVEPIWINNTDQALAYLNNCLFTGDDLPKLILLDLYLPGREDGWQLLQTIKEPGSSFRQVPIVVLSNSNLQEDITESYFYGSTSFVVKPSNTQGWVDYGQNLRTYWWETVTLPSARYI